MEEARLAREYHGLDDPEPEVRRQAIWGLVGWGKKRAFIGVDPTQDDRAPRFIQMLEDGDEGVRETAATALGRLADVRAVPALRKAAAGCAPRVSRAASWALRRIARVRGLDPRTWQPELAP